MKSLWSWVTDPCVHLVVIGLLLFHFAMGFGTDQDTTNDDVALCKKCDFVHGIQAPCSALASTRVPASNSR